MEIAIFIKELLYNYESVVVNGLGEFYTQYQHANCEKDQKNITPPSKIVFFNTDKKISTGLLENYISIKNRLTISESQQFILKEVNQIDSKLNQGQTIFFDGLGYLVKEGEQLHFSQDNNTNFNIGAFGLQVVDFKPVELKIHQKPKSETIIHNNKPQKRNLILTFAKIAGSIIICLGLYFSYPTIKSFLFQTKTSKNNNIQSEQPTVIENTNQITTDPLENIIDKTTDKKNALAPIPETPSDIHYYVIAGSFKTYERALALSQELENDGAKPEIIQFGTNIYRVSLGEFTEKRFALLELEKVRAIKGEEAVWLLTQKK